MRWFRIVSVVVGIALSLSLALAAQAGASGIGNAGDDLRTGWYPDESTLTPQLVAGGTFGQLWSAPVNGQVYAQPLLSNGTLVVATENDDVYGLDPGTGAQQWSDDLGTPFNPNDIGCGDILPSIGTTATPVIDPTTNTVYLTYKTYVSGSSGPAVWYMDALDVSTGAVRPGFPVELSGIAQNEPDATFIATNQQQRPGLLLMNGVVYAAFGSHCDYETWQGGVFGVSTAGQVTSRWVDNAPNSGGAGIWQSGVGLMSDEPGSLFFVTGNGGSPSTPTPGDEPPATFGESVVHLEVQPDGTLEPVDFFAPFDAPTLDLYDADFGSGGIVGLPPAYFGTPTIPNLGVVVGKGGYVYLLNLDDLGGYDQGSGGSDDVVDRVGPRGGVWGRAGIWPGDGGYIYIPTSSDANGGGNLDVYKYGVSGTGQPSLSLVATSSDVFGWGSGPPVITSDGTTSGSALVWVIWSANRSGAGGQLRAYDPVPVDGQPVLVYSAPIGDATNYSVPGVGDGRLYVGTRDGSVIAFGAPVSQALTGPAVTLPPTSIGSTSDGTLTLTAQTSVTLQSLSSNSAEFTLGTPSQTLPATLTAGQTISVPVTFAPSETGIVGGEVEATLGDGSTASIGGGSDSGAAVTPDQAATDVANAYCDRAQACAPAYVALSFGDIATCATRLKATLLPGIGAMGSTEAPAQYEACAAVVPSASCDDLLTRSLPAPCQPIPGTLATGAACAVDGQCASTHCGLPANAACGTCVALGSAGATCDTDSDCQDGMTCQSSACVAYGAENATCDTTHPCRPDLGCKAGACTAPSSVGTACQSGAECDNLHGVFCNPISMMCENVSFAGPNAPCGLVNNQLVVWGRSARTASVPCRIRRSAPSSLRVLRCAGCPSAA